MTGRLHVNENVCRYITARQIGIISLEEGKLDKQNRKSFETFNTGIILMKEIEKIILDPARLDVLDSFPFVQL